MGPVLKRWINADVVPIAALLRSVARAYLDSDMGLVAELLDTPQAELDRERPLKPLMEWLLRGSSPGRGPDDSSTFAEDLALAFMASTIQRIASKKDEPPTLAACLANAADALRDTVQGQFITSIHGATAMERVRLREPEHWRQKKSLTRICARLMAQVRPQLMAEERGEIELPVRNGRKVVMVRMSARAREDRQLELIPPDATAWHVMSLCWRDEDSSGTSPHRSLWLGLAGMFLAAAQKTGGWFEMAQDRKRRRGHSRTTKYLVLSERASEAIEKDVERWTSLGFWAQPMLCPPEGNDFLTIKHRPVSGQIPPLGLQTDPVYSSAWNVGAQALSSSPWTVNASFLAAHSATIEGQEVPLSPRDAIRLAEHKRLATETFYLPTTMDFRGRIYYRTPWVNPQSDDLGKALLCFPLEGLPGMGKPLGEPAYEDFQGALALHFTNLWGNGLDKGPLPERLEWFRNGPHELDLSKAKKPHTLRAALALMHSGETDRIPVQLDGTCNGFQHLAALTGDETLAPLVNLTESSLEDAPADLYGYVAGDAGMGLSVAYANQEPWARRFAAAGVRLDRSTLKGPVMVLPYGGTHEAIRMALKASILEQLPSSMLKSYGDSPWHRALGQEPYYPRDLHEHPLFGKDLAALGGLIYRTIVPAIPRAMALMKALQEIGAWVGERGLSWRVGALSSPEGASSEWVPLWVTQAKSKASRKQVKMRGFHLPNMVRRLTLMANVNEIDPRAHRAGIVANFIHSLDAAHLAASVSRFRAAGGGCVGSVHDCLLVRPSEAALMGRCLRDTFVELHEANPLAQPVRLYSDKLNWEAFRDWYHLAEVAGVKMPERGSYEVSEVRRSAWFFS